MRAVADANLDEHLAWLAEHANMLDSATLDSAVTAAMRGGKGRHWVANALIDERLPRSVATATRMKQMLELTPDVSKRLTTWDREYHQGRDAIRNAYQAAINLDAANLAAGRNHFRRRCASCHVIEGYGKAIGPDISDSRTQTPTALLDAILDPSASIDAGFVQYAVATFDGTVYAGLMVENGRDGVVLRTVADETVRVPTADVATIRRMNTSLMPEGLHAELTPEQMRDLIGYLKGWRGDFYATND